MLTIIAINETNYYNMKDLMELNRDFFHGCTSRPKAIVIKKKIPATDYIYANYVEKMQKWNITTVECRKSSLLITKEWVDAHFFNNKPKENEDGEAVLSMTELVAKSPPLLELEEHEKFKDMNGNALEIETRGDKTHGGIYFKVADVMKAFDMPKLNDALIHDNSGYLKNDDYFLFYIREVSVIVSETIIKKYLYLSYRGMLRVLFVSRNNRVKHFIDWAAKTLFTHQMGTEDDKQRLGTDLLQLSLKTYRAVFKCYASKFPCIYLLSLGKVGALRNTFGISDFKDDSVIYKYGFTEDLERRLSEHEAKYGKLANVTIQLSTFHMIDNKYTCEAEGDVRQICKSFQKSLEVDGYNELVVLDEKELLQIKKQFRYIGNDYAGATAELQRKIKELEEENRELKRDIVEKDLRYEMLFRDNQYQKNIFDLERQNYELKLGVIQS